MDSNLNFLNDIRIKNSQLIIEIGLQWIESFPHCDPQEFVDYYFPPRDSIMEILKEEQAKQKNRLDMIHSV